jgi:RND family efflux transporter MFP subunit
MQRQVLLVVAFGFGWVAANARRDQQQKEHLSSESSGQSRIAAAVTVTVEPAARRSVQRSVEALGTLHGFEEVVISARVEGRVRKLFHDVADRVAPGDLLLEIDSTDYELSVQQSDRALQVELAKLGFKEVPDAKIDLTRVPVVVKAKSIMEHAKSRHERFVQLAAKKTVSPEDSESAANDYRTAQAEYDNQMIQAESGLATIQLKQVDLLVAREQLANTKVSVPTPNVALPGSDGVTYVIAQRSVSEGTLVRVGTELFRIVISQTLKLRVPVPERYSAEIQRDQQVQVFTAAASKPFSGTVTRIYPTVDSATRTFQVEIQVPNPTGDLKPGSFAKAAILTRVDAEAVTVPLSALVQFAGITKIFLVDDGRAKEVPVTLGTQTTEWVEITSPVLPESARIVTSGQTALANDSKVVVRDSAKSTREANSPSPSPTAAEPHSRGSRE